MVETDVHPTRAVRHKLSWADRATLIAAVLVPGLLGGVQGLGNFLVLPFMKDFGAPRGSVIFLIEVGTLCMYLTIALVGRILTMVAPWLIMFVGALIAGGALLLLSVAPSLALAAAGFIAAQSLGLGLCGLIASQTIVVRRAPERQGTVSGAQTVALALTGVALPLLVAPQIETHGWRPTVAWCGVAVLALLPAMIVLFLRTRSEAAAAGLDFALDERSQSDLPFDEAAPSSLEILSAPAFWILMLAIVPVAILAQALAVNIIPFYAERGVGLQEAGYVLAAVGAGAGNEERVDALVAAGVDVLLIDSSHGHSEGVLQRIRDTRAKYPDLQIIGGNVATGAGARALADAGCSAVKVGIGPGSICTTRIVTGVGVPQITAVSDAVEALEGTGIPVIADGGIRFSGDIAKAIAAGAAAVMVGSMLAGTEESPGEIELYQGRSYKSYRGMGSLGAMSKGSSDRYFQTDNAADKLVPEGIEGRVAYKGRLKEIIHQQMGGLRSCMGLTGCGTIDLLRTKAEFVRISGAGIQESHVHDVTITKESPNYRLGS
jgi:IMP dehydrogenase/GMP reductase